MMAIPRKKSGMAIEIVRTALVAEINSARMALVLI